MTVAAAWSSFERELAEGRAAAEAPSERSLGAGEGVAAGEEDLVALESLIAPYVLCVELLELWERIGGERFYLRGGWSLFSVAEVVRELRLSWNLYELDSGYGGLSDEELETVYDEQARKAKLFPRCLVPFMRFSRTSLYVEVDRERAASGRVWWSSMENLGGFVLVAEAVEDIIDALSAEARAVRRGDRGTDWMEDFLPAIGKPLSVRGLDEYPQKWKTSLA